MGYKDSGQGRLFCFEGNELRTTKQIWDRHMPVMYQFWETVLFGKGGYKGNPVLKHVELNQKAPMTEQHFERWILLWESTIDEHFEGEIAEEAKKKAITMKLLMLYKIGQNGNPNFVQ